jgi:hypothetical protein
MICCDGEEVSIFFVPRSIVRAIVTSKMFNSIGAVQGSDTLKESFGQPKSIVR